MMSFHHHLYWPRALQAQALVQAHAHRQQNVFKLRMHERCELSVVVKREIIDQERGHEARKQRVDAEGHGARKDVSHFVLHDTDQSQHSSAGQGLVTRTVSGSSSRRSSLICW
jgi:hypothetical protein